MKIRLEFALTEQGRFIGHLDLSRNFERLLRRARLPLTFSQGFSPKPKLAFGSALAVGISSDAEYLDVTVDELDPEIDWLSRLNELAPPAFIIRRIAILEPGVKSLMSVVNRAQYELDVHFSKPVSQAELDQAISELLSRKELVITRFHENPRKQKEIDLRPGIYQMEGKVRGEGQSARIELLVKTGQSGNIKAQEPILAMISNNLLAIDKIGRIHRKALYIADEIHLQDPMCLPGVNIL